MRLAPKVRPCEESRARLRLDGSCSPSVGISFSNIVFFEIKEVIIIK